ncbi:hypothetical protein Taro_021159, partial [Colocasia esculenta]|nr:hypothetical protein [Colocasia esculenta]
QESEMEQYIEEKRVAQKRSVPPFQRQDRKKAVYQSPQGPVVASRQVLSTARKGLSTDGRRQSSDLLALWVSVDSNKRAVDRSIQSRNLEFWKTCACRQLWAGCRQVPHPEWHAVYLASLGGSDLLMLTWPSGNLEFGVECFHNEGMLPIDANNSQSYGRRDDNVYKHPFLQPEFFLASWQSAEPSGHFPTHTSSFYLKIPLQTFL